MAYDVYSVAMVWLRALAPALASKRMLDEFRTVVASKHHHLIEDWLDHGFELHADESSPDLDYYVRSGGSMGSGAYDHRLLDLERTTGSCVFSGDAGKREGKLAWRLLRTMMRPHPKDRVTAAEALAGPYLGGCVGIDDAADTSADPDPTASFLNTHFDTYFEEVPECTSDYSCYIPVHQATERSVEECELDDEMLEAERHTIAHAIALLKAGFAVKLEKEQLAEKQKANIKRQKVKYHL
jgi:hypothetical protein